MMMMMMMFTIITVMTTTILYTCMAQSQKRKIFYRSFKLKSTIGIFLRFLTLADLSALWTGVFYFAAKGTFHTNVRKTNELSCKIHFWLSYACCDLSSWALILVSSARLLSILRPMSRFISNRRAYAAILFTCVLALSVNLPIFFMYGDVYIPSRGITKHCVIADRSYRYFIVYVWTWIVLFKFAVVPGTILLGLNIVLIVHVYRSKRIIEDMQRGSFNKNFKNNKGKPRSNQRAHEQEHRAVTCSSLCCGCPSKPVPEGHGVYQLGRGFASKISFSRWRRKAVVLGKDAKSVVNNSNISREGLYSKSLTLPDGTLDATYSSSSLNESQKVCNGAVARPTGIHLEILDKQPKIKFQDETPTISRERIAELEKRPFRPYSLHESYADIKHLRDVCVWNDSNTSASVGESVLFLNHNTGNAYHGSKFKSCSDIPRTLFVKNKGNYSGYDRPCSLALLKNTKGKGLGSDQLEASAESSCDQFFTDPGLEITPGEASSQHLFRATSYDHVLYSDLQTGFESDPNTKGPPLVQTFAHADLKGNVNDRGVTSIRTSVNKDDKTFHAFLHGEGLEESEGSSSEEFFSCADETKFSPLLKNKNENYIPQLGKNLSKPSTLCQHLENHCKPVQSINIPGDPRTFKETQLSPYRNKEQIGNRDFSTSNGSQTVNVIVNDLAFLSDENYELPAICQSDLNYKVTKNDESPSRVSLLNIKSLNTNNSIKGDGKNSSVDPTLDFTFTSSNDCLRVETNPNICDINVTRCSSANDVISLNDETLGKTQDAITTATVADVNNHRTHNNNGCTSQVNDKTQPLKSDKLCVIERRQSAKKRDKQQVPLAELNLSLSSLGRTSLNSGNTDISSFTIAPPSAFTSAENLTTTTNAGMLRRGSGPGKFSAADQHAAGHKSAGTADKKITKSHQNKKKGQKKSMSMFPKSSARPKNLTRTLLVINSVFLICNIPIVIYMTGKTYFFPGGYNDRQNLFNACANFIMYTNNALNFLLYCLTGTRFRHQLRAMFMDVGIVVRGSIKRPPRRAHL
ncbi:FMRFamide receptor-like [Elysia marginata]|uniref:FMRFamide receptor-like n=1 Tax=Elysia marginata TaxID=1093978 RepID=A0AAV4EWK1_9GAST|nr:FMRFamide receptor-like [Elysia marginata]